MAFPMLLTYLLILSQTNTASFMEKKRFQQEFYCHIEKFTLFSQFVPLIAQVF